MPGATDAHGRRRGLWNRLRDWLTEELPPDAAPPPARARPEASEYEDPAPTIVIGAPLRTVAPRPAAAEAPVRARRGRRAARGGIWRGILLPLGGGAAAFVVLALIVLLGPGRGLRQQAAPPPHAASPAASSATGTAPTGSAPDCQAMGMIEVPGTAGGPQSVAGLCYALGNGEDWLVGCAPGAQATCDPALQPVLSCLRRTRGPVTTADVTACAASWAAG